MENLEVTVEADEQKAVKTRINLYPLNIAGDAKCDPLLYRRCSGNVRCFPDGSARMDRGASLSFDTYFNAFSAEKWRLYTRLVSVAIAIRIKGRMTITVLSIQCDEKGNPAESVLFQDAFASESTENYVTPDFSLDEGSLYALRVASTEDGSILSSAEYVGSVDGGVRDDVSLCISMCTHHREHYVKKNLASLAAAVFDRPESALHGRLHLFLADNGQTLNADASASRFVSLFSLPGLGGSAGNARCMIEAMRGTKVDFTHVIVMDDDVVIEPGALTRIFVMLTVLRDEYAEHDIAGAMLRLDKRHIQHESGASFVNLSAKARNCGFDLRRIEKVIENERIDESPAEYGAWFFCCIPLRRLRESGMHFPAFLLFDDVECGIRSGKRPLTLNGVAVWHEAFPGKESNAKQYYSMRNALVAASMLGRATFMTTMRVFLARALNAATSYRYARSRLVARGVRDFLRGVDWMRRVDMAALHEELLQGDERPISFQEAEARGFKDPAAGMRPMPRFLIRFLTANGWLLPSSVKRITVAATQISPKRTYRACSVFVRGEDGRGFIVEKSYRRLARSLGEIAIAAAALCLRFSRISRQFRQRQNELRAVSEWETRLGLARPEEESPLNESVLP